MATTGFLYEKRWPTNIESFTLNGGSDGLITVSDTTGFFVSQIVFISATGLPQLELKVKRVISATQLYVGPNGSNSNIDTRTNVSAYTVALNAQIYATEQLRPNIQENYITRAVYQEEPAVALRVIQVDKLGNPVGGSGGVSSNTNVQSIGGVAFSLGQKTMASSFPIVIASNQSSIPVSLDLDLEQITPQFASLVSTSITASTPGTANTLVTASGDKTLAMIRNSTNRPLGVTVGTTKWIELVSNQVAVFDLATNGKKIENLTTIGTYYLTSLPTNGEISISLV